MPDILITMSEAVDLSNLGYDLVGYMADKEDEMIALGVDEIEWTLEERKLVLSLATLVAFLSKCNIACYPLSESSTIFFP